jgi:hypothetical protein
VPIDGSISFYDFHGDPGLLPTPTGGVPWDQVRTYAVGLQARYRIDDRWILLGEVNVASAGARGAVFEDTLSVGGTFGASYRFGPDLTWGPPHRADPGWRSLVLPVPTVEVLPFDDRRWRLWPASALGLGRTAARSGLLTRAAASPTRGSSWWDSGVSSASPRTAYPDGVGRDSALPLSPGSTGSHAAPAPLPLGWRQR